MCQFWWTGWISWHCVEKDFEVQWKRESSSVMGEKRWHIHHVFAILGQSFPNKLAENYWIKEITEPLLIILGNKFNIFSNSDFEDRYTMKRLDHLFL